jgi:hypothetical protein
MVMFLVIVGVDGRSSVAKEGDDTSKHDKLFACWFWAAWIGA